MDRMHTQSWYRWISAIYDPICKPLFHRARLDAVASLELNPGDTVLDLCCGTGLNLPYLSAAVGASGTVIGLDFTPQMLDRAKRRRKRHQLKNVMLRALDGRELHADHLNKWTGRADVDAVLCTFGFAVAPEWEQLRDRAWNVLRPGGRLSVADNRPFTRWPQRAINWPWIRLANLCGWAEIRRPTWILPQGTSQINCPRPYLGGFVFVTSGNKPPVIPEGIRGTSSAKQPAPGSAQLGD